MLKGVVALDAEDATRECLVPLFLLSLLRHKVNGAALLGAIFRSVAMRHGNAEVQVRFERGARRFDAEEVRLLHRQIEYGLRHLLVAGCPWSGFSDQG